MAESDYKAMRDPLVWVLSSAAVIAWAVLLAPTPAPSPDLVTGTDLSSVELLADGGEVDTLAGEPTLLMVFRSTCGWCVRHAPKWTEFLEDEHGVRTFAVTDEEPETGQGFADEHGWDVDIRQISASGSRIRWKTPWFVVTSPDGHIAYQGHGGDVRGLTAFLESGVHAKGD